MIALDKIVTMFSISVKLCNSMVITLYLHFSAIQDENLAASLFLWKE